MFSSQRRSFGWEVWFVFETSPDPTSANALEMILIINIFLGEWVSTFSYEPLDESHALCERVVVLCKYWLIAAPSLGISILQVLMHLWYLCYAARFVLAINMSWRP